MSATFRVQPVLTNPCITIVICTHNRPALLDRCLGSLSVLEYTGLQVLVVDNAPITSETRLLAERYKTGYKLAPVQGLSRARNIGLQECTTDIIAFLDDDMIPHPQWLTALSATFADPAIMAVTGPMLPLSLATAASEVVAASLQQSDWGPKPYQVDRNSPDWFERANFGGIGDGNLAIRRSVLSQWRGFEESIGRGTPINGGEDHYAYFSLIALGHRIAYNPEAIVFHPPNMMSAEHKLEALTLNAAYTCLLLARYPQFIARMLWFAIGGLCGKKRWWRPDNLASNEIASSWWLNLHAILLGLQLFWRNRRNVLISDPGGK